MKTTIKLVSLLGLAVLFSGNAMAVNLKLRGGVTNNSYTLDTTSSTGTTSNYGTASYSGNTLGATLLFSDSSGYLDVATSNGDGNWSGKYTSGTPFTSTMKHNDNSIILGAIFPGSGGNSGNLYAGWKNGETSLDRAPGANTNPSLKFKTSGFVFGGGGGIGLGGAGTLGLSLGMGIMSGEYDTTALNTTTNTYNTTTNKADLALGFSYGISYSYPFTKNFGVSVDYKGNLYNYTFNSGLSTEWSLTETFNTTSALLYVIF